MIRWLGERLGILEPYDEEGDQVRAEAHRTATEARKEVNESRAERGVPSLEYDLLRRGHKALPQRTHR